MDSDVRVSADPMRKLLDPRSVAIIGASSDPGKAGGRPIHYMKLLGYAGKIFPVNPARREIAGLPAYPSLKTIPEPVDLCVVTVPGDLVEAALLECAEAGIKAAVVFASGFAEVGKEGRAAQRRLAEIAQANGIALCGPNCLGLINVGTGMAATFTSALLRREAIALAPLAFVSQSGALAAAILAMMQDAGFGLSHFITTGNEASLGFADFADHILTHTDVRAVAGYLEGVDGPALLALAGKALALGKPLVLMKVGASDAGARASLTHTGNLAGDDAVSAAAFRQFGIQRVGTVDELLDVGHAFTLAHPPRGRGAGIVSISGGGGVLMADWCERLGLSVAPLAEATCEGLRSVLPWFATPQNPLDTTGRPLWDDGLLEKAIAGVAADPSVDIVLVYIGLATGVADRIASEILAARATQPKKPFLVCWLPEDDPAPIASLRAMGIPVHGEPVRMVRAAAALADWGAALARGAPRAADPGAPSRFDFASLPPGRSVAESAAKAFLAAAGIGATREALAGSADEAVRQAEALGYPVCVKIVSPDIPHRTEIGAVRLAIADEAALRVAYNEVLQRARAHKPDARIDGVLVQEMVTGGLELLVSGFRDPVFGPVVMCGAGGILVEVLRDTAMRIAPVSRDEAIAMLGEMRVAPMLEGVRGSPPLDAVAAAEVIVRVSEIIHAAEGRLETIEINPLAVLVQGRGVRALDALITRPAEAEGVEP